MTAFAGGSAYLAVICLWRVLDGQLDVWRHGEQVVVRASQVRRGHLMKRHHLILVSPREGPYSPGPASLFAPRPVCVLTSGRLQMLQVVGRSMTLALHLGQTCAVLVLCGGLLPSKARMGVLDWLRLGKPISTMSM